MWVIYISLLVFLMIPLKIRVLVRIELEGEQVNISIQFYFSRLCMNSFTYSLDLDNIKKFVTDEGRLKNKKGLSISDIRKIYRRLLSRIFIENFTWKTTLGLTNAAHTAWGVGILWIIKGGFLSFLSSQTGIKKIYISIYPDFMCQNKNSELFCIVRIAIVHIILIGIYIFYLKSRRFRDGRKRNR